MNWESFVPDLIVGLMTGGIVGLIVLGAERRIAARARRVEVSNAQGAVVDRGRTLLQHRISFTKKGQPALQPNASQLDRLRELVIAVPTGQPMEYLPGYHWAERAALTFEELQAVTEALESRTAEHNVTAGLSNFIGPTIEEHVHRFATEGVTDPSAWVWEWDGNSHPEHLDRVKNDEELTQSIVDYIQLRRRLVAYREAFLAADGLWRADQWIAITARFKGVPHNPVKARYRRWIYDRAVKAAEMRADEQARKIVAAVDPMA